MIPLLRTSLVTGLFAGLILLGYWRLAVDQRDRTIEELRALSEDMERRVAEREAMIGRLSQSRRLAHLEIVDQRREDQLVAETDVLLIELRDNGSELARQQFTVPGDVIFVDAWTAKFDHDHVAQGHPMFGRTLILLRRIYSELMAPQDGFTIDTPGAIPPAYAVGEIGRFEQRLWDQFWQIAADPVLARQMGVRVAQGEAVYKAVRSGQRFELTIDADGGMNLVPLPEETTLSIVDG